MFQTIAVLDDKNRYWELDLELSDGTEDFIYNEQWYPGDDAEVTVLAARVELKSRKGRTKVTKVDPECAENHISWQKISRQLR